MPLRATPRRWRGVAGGGEPAAFRVAASAEDRSCSYRSPRFLCVLQYVLVLALGRWFSEVFHVGGR